MDLGVTEATGADMQLLEKYKLHVRAMKRLHRVHKSCWVGLLVFIREHVLVLVKHHCV